MSRQSKQRSGRKCPVCDGPMKRTIGAISRQKYWVCINNGNDCYRKPVVNGK